jgi:hypothetical protein
VIQDFGNEKLEELSNGKGKLAETFEECQGPHRAVKPMMLMRRGESR